MKIFGSHFLVLAFALVLGYWFAGKYPGLLSKVPMVGA